MASSLERQLAWQIQAIRLPDPETEHRFAPPRRWRLDLAWPQALLAVEIEGGIWTNGRHTRGAGFLADCEKYNEATLLGWRILRVTREHIESGQALRWIERALTLPNQRVTKPPDFSTQQEAP